MLAYRMLTSADDAAFCHKVTRALASGWSLHGGPAYGFDAAAGVMRCAQAVVKEIAREYDPQVRLGDL